MPVILATQEDRDSKSTYTKSKGDPITTNKKLGVMTHTEWKA
jgi:hypothetical protein